MAEDATDWAAQAETRLLDAALPLVPRLGWTRALGVKAGAAIGLSAAEVELLLPQGPEEEDAARRVVPRDEAACPL